MKKFVRIISNKFLIATAAFGIWMFFFDANDYVARKERHKELNDTKASIQYLQEEITRMEKDYQGLTQDPKALEKYAREQYRMKRDNEDLYIVE